MNRVLFAAAAVVGLMAFGSPLADPEQSYQAGKAAKEAVTGDKTKVDDRDLEAKARDYAREAGAKAGGGGKEKDNRESDKGKPSDGGRTVK